MRQNKFQKNVLLIPKSLIRLWALSPLEMKVRLKMIFYKCKELKGSIIEWIKQIKKNNY